MNILISNDDGYMAPGVNCLADMLSEIANVIVVAPDRNRSGASNSLTLDRPLYVRKIKDNMFAVNGTPTDCVHLGCGNLRDFVPDMVVSGINEGPNLGDDVLYSGTVAGAIEGRSLGLPSIAVSLNYDAKHYETAAIVTKYLVLQVAENVLPSHTILNVNVPNVPIKELGAYEITRLGTRHRAEQFIKQIDPRGHEIYWTGLLGDESDAGSGTDFHAIRANHVSITPLKLDWTDYKEFDRVSDWVGKLNKNLSK